MIRTKTCWRPQGRFLREFSRTCSVSAACRASGLARRTVYNWRDRDADFRARWEAARARGVEQLRDEAMQRALVGTEQPVWHGKRIVDRVAVPDNRVLWNMLQALQADIYGPNARERQAKRERDAALTRELDAAEKRVAVYEAELRAKAAWANTDDEK